MPFTADFSPTLRLLALAALGALLPLAWVWLRRGRGASQGRLAALTAVTLFLTFDLIVFGAFTRLTDSGLGCPDWPGCYGHASPIGAEHPIAQAEAALPGGPVTAGKAWIEMIHRYLAMVVGALCLVIAVASWAERRRLPHSPWWPTLTLLWVVVQGLFGKYTVTLKLYPAIVTLHLLGGLVLLALLALQRESFLARPLPLPAPRRRALTLLLVLVVLQIALGGWVSTNYAVLACGEIPTCNGGRWWPDADFANGFTLLRPLGHTGAGAMLPFEALVAIHLVHRWFAVVVALAALLAGWRLLRSGDAALARWGRLLLALIGAQVLTGLSNVVLQWPLAAALAHTAGAAALVLALTLLLARSRPAVVAAAVARPPSRASLPGLA
ncbi:MAG: COX15/CtaA family protein [Rubrivivax sp.]